MFSARTFSLLAVLYATWLLLSGIWEPFLMVVGAVCCALVVFLAKRMDVIDGEGHPIHLSWRALFYFPWLFGQIARSNIAVARIVLWPGKLDISPVSGRIRATQTSDVGLVTFANSITLTPGTVSLSVYPDEIMVHALTSTGFDHLAAGEMNRRVSAMESGA